MFLFSRKKFISCSPAIVINRKQFVMVSVPMFGFAYKSAKMGNKHFSRRYGHGFFSVGVDEWPSTLISQWEYALWSRGWYEIWKEMWGQAYCRLCSLFLCDWQIYIASKCREGTNTKFDSSTRWTALADKLAIRHKIKYVNRSPMVFSKYFHNDIFIQIFGVLECSFQHHSYYGA